MNKILQKIIFCLIVAAIPVAVLNGAFKASSMRMDEMTGLQGGERLAAVEKMVAAGFPFAKELKAAVRGLDFLGGQREIVGQSFGYQVKQNGIFVTRDSLMKNIDPPIARYVDENIAGVVEFAEYMREGRKQTYFMLLPTSGAIIQQKLPKYADSAMVNQRRVIENAYSRAAGSAVTIDAYAALIARQNQYIYYRTENNLTSLGGYYVYAAMMSRLGLGKASLSQFDIDYVNNYFYGDLCYESGYMEVTSDSVSLFRYSASNRSPHEFMVTHSENSEQKIYHTLFPQSAAEIGDELDVFLGGLSAVTDIRSKSQYSTSILVFGDKTAIAYLPFLANSCGRITFVDLFYDRGEFEDINPYDYDKIIFAYGIETFMHTNNPSRAVALIG